MPTRCLELKESPYNARIRRFIRRRRRELDRFFDVKLYEPSVILLESRAQIDALQGKKTEDWLIGWTSDRNVYILHPDMFESESSHKRDEFYLVLKHEVVHLYFSLLTGTFKPRWLNEGLAVHLAKQHRAAIHGRSLRDSVDVVGCFDRTQRNIYVSGGKVVSALISKFGKKRLLELIRTIRDGVDEAKFAHEFRDIYGFPLSPKDLLLRLEPKPAGAAKKSIDPSEKR